MRKIAVAIVALCVATVCSAHARPAAEPHFIDQRGTAFTLSALRGAPVVLSFVATRCTDACPITAGVFERLAREHLRTQLVIVTLDSQYDTPFVMARYARTLRAQAPQWRVASGAAPQIDRLLDALRVTRVADDVHSTFLYCFDPSGRLDRVLPLSSDSVRDIRAWLAGRTL